MDLRFELVRLIRQDGVSVTVAARTFGISRKTAYKWLDRFDEAGRGGLADRSRARHSQDHRTPEEVRKALMAARRRHPSWGPRKLLGVVKREGWRTSELPAPSTVGSMLKAAGLVEPRRRRDRAEHGPGVRATSSSPNDLWTADFKGDFLLGDGSRCYPLTIQDHHARFMITVRAFDGTHSRPVRDAFRRAFRDFGVPRRILTDNGPPFAAPSLTGISLLTADWMRQGIRVERSRPGHPSDNGAHERMHRDLKRETTRPPCRTSRGQQHRFTRWIAERNNVRPHESLGGRTPSGVYEPSRRAYEERPPAWEYPGHWETPTVRRNGMAKCRRDLVFVASTLAGERLGLEEIDDGLWRVWYRQTELGLLNERGSRGHRLLMPHAWWSSRTSDDSAAMT